jgi:hypothetical protein
MRYRDFYTELGKLLYAVAKADGKVGAKEFEAMKTVVQKELLPMEDSRDQFGTDNAYYAEMEFEYLEENFGDPDVAFDSFIDFVETHKTAITLPMKEMVKNISHYIANSEFGINKKEQSYLEKLAQKIGG